MKKRNIYFIILVSAAVLIGIIFLIGVIQKESEIPPEENKNNRVERINNLLKNSSFENELGSDNWEVSASDNYSENGFDNLIKYDKDFSYNFSSESDSAKTFLFQKLSNIKSDMKLSLLGFLKTEDCDSARFEIDLIYGDSLLARGYSPAAVKTTDWEEYNAWIKTFLNDNFDKKLLSAEVKCILYGNGRAWFDNVRLYSIPVKQSIYDMQSYIEKN